jgi:hypothetical protein
VSSSLPAIREGVADSLLYRGMREWNWVRLTYREVSPNGCCDVLLVWIGGRHWRAPSEVSAIGSPLRSPQPVSWNLSRPACVQSGMDETEREVIRADGFDPDDPAVVTAIDLVRWELSMLKGHPARRRAGDLEAGVG